MSFELCSSLAIVYKAGAGANSSAASSNAILSSFYNFAAAKVNTLTRKDWLAVSMAILTNFKEIIGDTISDYAAMKVINYDMNGYTSRLEAQTMLDVLRDNASSNIDALKEIEVQEVMF